MRRLKPQPQLYIVPVEHDHGSNFKTIDDFLHKADPSEELTFTRVPFSYPLMICYSSGTTGKLS